MPERNLVVKLRNDKRFILLVATLTIVTMQLGCSKFRQSALGRDFLDSKRQPSWTNDSEKSASHADADMLDPSEGRNDSARFVGVSDDAIDSDSKTIKLVSHQPATEAPCDHHANCDCFKKKLKPKLPYAEPIEPPSAVATMTPPMGLVSRPLAPILLNAQTRAIQATETTSNNSLRSEHGSIEQDANLVKPDSEPPMPYRIAAADIEVNPIRYNPAEDRIAQPIRNYTWSNPPQSEITNLSPPATSNCPCDGPTCDGSCKTHSRRNGLQTGLPGEELVQASVTATNSTQPLPPFPECPPDEALGNRETEFVPELEIIVPETDLAAVETRKMFGPAPANNHDCPRCTSKHCNDPNCGLALAAAISEFDSEFESDDFQPQQNEIPAAPIAETSTKEFDNDFAMASHTVDVGDAEPEIDASQLAWPTAEATDPTPKRPENTAPQTVEQPLRDVFTFENPETDDSSPVADKPQRSGELVKTVVKTENAEPAESTSDLQVINGTLCTEVTGFGQFKPFPNSSFESGQRMLVYCEVENYASRETAVDFETQFVTRLRGSYAIHDAAGRVVQEAEYPIVEDVARNRRQDFYMHFPIQLGDLQPGPYRIELRVEDLNGNKTAALSTGMEFKVR